MTRRLAWMLGAFSAKGAPELPRWGDVVVVPLVNLLVALIFTGLMIAALGENPFEAVAVMMRGAFVVKGGLGYTLYYATNLIFTGLCVAVAFHALQFNIGGEGQALIGGLGIGLVFLALGENIPFLIALPLGIIAAAAFGGVWGLIPGYLHAKRGSHIVITTIMFNFIAAAFVQYLLVNVLIEPGQMSPQTREFAEATHLPYWHEIAKDLGLDSTRTPLNASIILALICAAGVWVLIWRTPWGYALRAVGQSETAAVYGGIVPAKLIMQVMFLSGALAGLMAVNAVMGDNHRLIVGFSAGYGFAGIGVALMGRNHPVGIVLAAVLFGILIQGGSELDFEFDKVTRDVVEVVQGLIILFTGALANLFRPPVARAIALFTPRTAG